MATYRMAGYDGILETDESDVSPFTFRNTNLYDNTTTPTDLEWTITMNSGQTYDLTGWITLADVPNNDSWEDGGTQTITLFSDVDNSTCDVRIKLVSINSSGTILQEGAYGSAVTLSASVGSSVNVTCSAPTWTHTEACGNRLAMRVEFADTRGHGGSTSYTLQCGKSSNYSILVSDISEDTGGCTGGAARRIFITHIG